MVKDQDVDHCNGLLIDTNGSFLGCYEMIQRTENLGMETFIDIGVL